MQSLDQTKKDAVDPSQQNLFDRPDLSDDDMLAHAALATEAREQVQQAKVAKNPEPKELTAEFLEVDEPAKEIGPTKADVSEALQKLAARKDVTAVERVLAGFQVRRVGELSRDQYGKAIEAANRL